MKGFPDRIRALPVFDGPFDARRLDGVGCQVLFASYPAGTKIGPHRHGTENVGVITRGELILGTVDGEERFGVGDWYRLAADQEHWARFETDTSEIEFWFDPGRS